MSEFNTGYRYIDETADKIKNELSGELKNELNFILERVHSLGVERGYSSASTPSEYGEPSEHTK